MFRTPSSTTLVASVFLVLVVADSVHGQLSGLFGGRSRRQPSDTGLNIIMDTETSPNSPVKSAVIGCAHGECNQYVANPMVPVLKNAIPIPLASTSSSSTADLISSLAAELGLTKEDMKDVGMFEQKMKAEKVAQGSPSGQASGPEGRHSFAPAPLPQQGYGMPAPQNQGSSLNTFIPSMSSMMNIPQMNHPVHVPMMSRPPLPTPSQPFGSKFAASYQRPSVTVHPIYVPIRSQYQQARQNVQQNLNSFQNMFDSSAMQLPSQSFQSESAIPFGSSEQLPPFANPAALMQPFNSPVAAIQALQGPLMGMPSLSPSESQQYQQQPFKHSSSHPMEALNSMLQNGFINDINKIPQPFSYNHNHGLPPMNQMGQFAGMSSDDQPMMANNVQKPRQSRFHQLTGSFMSSFPSLPSLWGAQSVIRKKTVAAGRQPQNNGDNGPRDAASFESYHHHHSSLPDHIPSPSQSGHQEQSASSYDPFSGPAQIPDPISLGLTSTPKQESRFVPTFVGSMGSLQAQSLDGANFGIGMPALPVEESKSRLEQGAEAMSASEGYPIFDAAGSRVLRVKHNPVDILKIFADAYGKYSTVEPNVQPPVVQRSVRNEPSQRPSTSSSYPVYTSS